MVEEILRDAIPIDEPFEYKGKLIQTYEIPISLSTRWAESCKYCCFNYNGICKFLPHPYRYFYKELIIMERKIGEIFEFGGEWYQCVEGRCKDCHFSEKRYLCKQFIVKNFCLSGIIFKKLEKEGEPYIEHDHSMNKDVVVQDYKLYNQHACYNGYEKILCFGLFDKDGIVTIKSKEPIKSLNCENSVEIEIKQSKEDMEENKLNLKPFDIQKAKEGKPVCTRDGRKARIICFDAKGKQPIIALLEREKTDEEIIQTYSMNGRYYEFRKEDHRDLMMLSEKKEGWAKVRKDINLYDTKEEADRKMIGNDEYVTAKVCWEE